MDIDLFMDLIGAYLRGEKELVEAILYEKLTVEQGLVLSANLQQLQNALTWHQEVRSPPAVLMEPITDYKQAWGKAGTNSYAQAIIQAAEEFCKGVPWPPTYPPNVLGEKNRKRLGKLRDALGLQ